MKRMTKLTALVLSLLMLAASLVGMVACDKGEDTTTTTPDPQPPTYTVITIAQAIELCGEEGNITKERYYIRGTIDTVTNAQYGAMIISWAAFLPFTVATVLAMEVSLYKMASRCRSSRTRSAGYSF